MYPTHIIGKHLFHEGGHPINICAMCGATKLNGYSITEIIGPSFMDYDSLNNAKEICIYCVACLGYGQPRAERLVSTSFLATPSKLKRLKRENL